MAIYVVDNSLWHSTGALTWASGTTPTRGTVSAANSFIGSLAGQQVVVLPNSNYILLQSGGAAFGWATWFDGSNGSTFDGQNTRDDQNTLVASSTAEVTPIGSGKTLIFSAPHSTS